MTGHVRGHLFLRVLFDTHLHHYPLAYEIVIFVRGRLVDSATVRSAGVRSGAAIVALAENHSLTLGEHGQRVKNVGLKDARHRRRTFLERLSTLLSSVHNFSRSQRLSRFCHFSQPSP